jgi:2-phosphosulfolactate phosphatase
MAVVDAPPWARRDSYDVRFDWGPAGLLAARTGPVVVVDVLRFTTAVEAACQRGVAVYPYRCRDEGAAAYARSVGAILAGGADRSGPSLSPASLALLDPSTAVVLPSPNGSTCAVLAQESGATVVAGCLRNASAVARWSGGRPGPVTVIACGERWPDGSLRPAVEDLIGAGAIIAGLSGACSPEASVALGAFRSVEADLGAVLAGCASGRELTETGWRADVDYAAALDASTVVPVLSGGAFAPVGDPDGHAQ